MQTDFIIYLVTACIPGRVSIYSDVQLSLRLAFHLYLFLDDAFRFVPLCFSVTHPPTYAQYATFLQ